MWDSLTLAPINYFVSRPTLWVCSCAILNVNSLTFHFFRSSCTAVFGIDITSSYLGTCTLHLTWYVLVRVHAMDVVTY